MYFKFKSSDIFDSTIYLNPSKEILITQSGVFLDRRVQESSNSPSGSLFVYDINGGAVRTGAQLIKPLMPRTSELWGFNYQGDGTGVPPGDVVVGSYLIEKKHERWHITPSSVDTNKIKKYSIKNSLQKYSSLWIKSGVSYLDSYGQFFSHINSQNLSLITFPRVFFGSAIEKGTTELSMFFDNTLTCSCADIYQDGLLRVTLGSGSAEKAIVGTVLYEEGCVVLFDNAIEYTTATYDSASPSTFKWSNFGAAPSSSTTVYPNPCKFLIKFKGVVKTNIKTIFCHAEAGKLNHTNNITYIERGQDVFSCSISPFVFSENDTLVIKNLHSASYSEQKFDNFEKQTFISYINLYDKDKTLLAIAKLATPILKKETDSCTFKLTLDT
jgi:hypothetical protein